MMTNTKRLITLQRVGLVSNPVDSACSAAASRAGRMNNSTINRLRLPRCAPTRCAIFVRRSDALLIQARLERPRPGARSLSLPDRSLRVLVALLVRSNEGGLQVPRRAVVPSADSSRHAPVELLLHTRQACLHSAALPRAL